MDSTECDRAGACFLAGTMPTVRSASKRDDAGAGRGRLGRCRGRGFGLQGPAAQPGHGGAGTVHARSQGEQGPHEILHVGAHGGGQRLHGQIELVAAGPGLRIVFYTRLAVGRRCAPGRTRR